MRKNIITKVLAIIMATALGITGCGEANESTSAKLTTGDVEDVGETEEEAKTSSSVSLAKNDDEMFKSKATIEETVISQEGGVIITAKNLVYYEDSAELQIEIDNTSDANVEVHSETLGYAVNEINGMSMEFGYINAAVNAGMKSNEVMTISADELKLCGMNDIASIVVGFNVCDEDYNELFVTEPFEIRTSIYDSYDFEKDTMKEAMTGDVWTDMGVTFDYLEPEINLEQNGVKILLAAIAKNKSDERTLFLEIQNGSEENYNMDIRDISVNGIVVCKGNWKSCYVGEGKRAVFDVDMDYLLEDYSTVIDMDEIGKISFDIECRRGEELKVVDTIGLELAINDSIEDVQMQGKNVYDEEGIKINYADAYTDENGDTCIIPIFVENNTDADIDVDDEYDSFAINGVMANGIMYSQTVSAGQIGILNIEIDDSDLEKIGITSFDEIETAQITLGLDTGNYSNRKKIDIVMEQ